MIKGWKPISEAPPEVADIVRFAAPPQVGQHVGRCYTLDDGRWVVLMFSSHRPTSYFILPEPPR
jgi:hypothetical protein